MVRLGLRLSQPNLVDVGVGAELGNRGKHSLETSKQAKIGAN